VNTCSLASGSRKPFAPSSFKDAIKRLEPNGATAHGFRSSFRDWCAECTNFPREVCELALAHRVGDAVEAAYRRSDLLERRRELMEAWCVLRARASVCRRCGI
jgi:integrase